ncbi:hypothetical protein B296_00032122, partial [Ensete ventricosum]
GWWRSCLARRSHSLKVILRSRVRASLTPINFHFPHIFLFLYFESLFLLNINFVQPPTFFTIVKIASQRQPNMFLFSWCFFIPIF